MTAQTRPGGRTLTYDDVGDPGGVPVLYLHGTPDSRLARHPDDGLAARAGVRLLAVDRPGYGGTSPVPPGGAPPPVVTPPVPVVGTVTEGTGRRDDEGRPGVTVRPAAVVLAGDLVALLDGLGIERAALVAWSGGALDGLAAAADPRLTQRLVAVHLLGGLVPRQAFDDPDVRQAGQHRLGLLDLADDLPPAELAEAVAPLLAPWPCDRALALDHQREQRSPADQAALEAIPGARERLADALVEAVRHGLAGVATDLAAQVAPPAVDLASLPVPVRLWYGTADTVTPPAFGHWYARHLRTAQLRLVEGAGHYLPFTHWPPLLAALAADH